MDRSVVRNAPPPQVQSRADGSTLIHCRQQLHAYPERLTDWLAHWAREVPSRVCVAQRGHDGGWRSLTYGELHTQTRRIGEALARRGLGPERPIVILSGNDLQHFTLAMAALWVGVPWAAASPAYALVSRDHAKLRHVADTLTPGLVFAADASYGVALDAAVGEDVEVVLGTGKLAGRATTPWETLLASGPSHAEQVAHSQVGPSTLAKFLFTSGSTRVPKAVPHTHRMLCSNQQMIRQSFPFLAEEPPVLVDWPPWNHTFGGNHNIGIVLYNGGTLYIDGGRPTAEGMTETLCNLREISPTFYFNVPKGFEELAQALEQDAVLRTRFFARCRAWFYAGAGLSQAVWDRLDRVSTAVLGEPLAMVTGFGMTETSPACTFATRADLRAGHIGLPSPGVEVKLTPLGLKTELRFRGPNVMEGYWRSPELTHDVFDEEGFYRTGDAVRWVDDTDPQRGLLFDGRIAEDFKLSTGTWVSVGPLRERIIQIGAPYVQDAVITAPNRDEIGMLLFPRMEECRRPARLEDAASKSDVLAAPALVDLLHRILQEIAAQSTGSAARVTRAAWFEIPPSIDHGEVTDKGSINQSAVLA